MEDLTKKLVGSLQLTENDVISHSIDIFRPVSQEVSMTGGKTISIRPISMSQDGPFEFQIHPRGDYQYIELSKTRLYMKLKIVKADGTNTAANICGTNLLGSSLFKQVDIEIGGKLIPDLTNTHFHYKTYLETILSYSETARQSHLKAHHWTPDDAGAFDDVKWGATDTEQSKNTGYVERCKTGKDSKLFEIMFPLHSDFLQSDRAFPPGVRFNIRLTKEKDAFFLMTNSTDPHKILIEDMKLYMHYVDIDRRIFESHANTLQTKPFLLPINKSDVRTQSFAAGLKALNVPALFTGNLPKHIIIGIVKNKNYHGSFDTNPYNFENNSINYIALRVNGALVPTDPYEPNFDDNLFVREYRSFFDNLGIHHDDAGNFISAKYYKNGCTLFAFDLTPDRCNGFHFHPTATGTIDLEVKLKNTLTDTVTIMAFATYNAIISIDKDFNVNVDV
jgi:hypothetical protein